VFRLNNFFMTLYLIIIYEKCISMILRRSQFITFLEDKIMCIYKCQDVLEIIITQIQKVIIISRLVRDPF